jgi:hypothetical protein
MGNHVILIKLQICLEHSPYETFSLDFELFANNSSGGARLKNQSSYHASITSKFFMLT